MCILHIPLHPWCTCPNPAATDPSNNKPANLPAPHLARLLLHQPPTRLAPSQIPHHALLSRIPRPARKWTGCKLYLMTHHLDLLGPKGKDKDCEGVGQLNSLGREHACPNAKIETYIWEGLCADCDDEKTAGGIQLPLVPVMQMWALNPENEFFRDESVDESVEEGYVELVRDGVERVDGAAMEQEVEERIVALLEEEEKAPAAVGAGEESTVTCNQRRGVLVDIVQGPGASGARRKVGNV